MNSDIVDGFCIGVIAALLVLLGGWLIGWTFYQSGALALGSVVGNTLIGVMKHVLCRKDD